MTKSVIASWRISRLQICAAILVGLMACGSGSDSVSGPGADSTAADFSRSTRAKIITTVSVTSTSSTVNFGNTLQLAAAALNSLGGAITGNVVAWTSSDTTVLAVSSTGLATPVKPGTASVKATIAGISGSETITVVAVAPGAVSNLAVAAVNDTSATLTFTEVANGAGGAAAVDIRFAPAPIQWGSATSVARGTCAVPVAGTTVGSTLTCTVLGLAPGTSYNFELVTFRGTLNVNAVFGNQSNVVAGTTTAPVVGSVTVTPATATSNVGAKLALVATVKDKNNNVMTGKPVAWMSSNAAIATVDSTGMTTGIAPGAVTFTATVAGVSGIATVTETAVVGSVTVTPATATSNIGAKLALVATVRDQSNNIVTGKPVTWTSSNAAIATVDSTGMTTAISAGAATFTATVAGVSGTATVTVAALPPGTVSTLAVAAVNDTSATLTFTEVADGAGGAAAVDIRFAPAPIQWGSATSVTRGTCASVAGTTVGSTVTCTVLGLTPGTAYNFELVAFRGTLNVNAVFGNQSNVAATTTTTTTVPTVASVTVMPATATSNVGAKLALVATVKDKNNNVMTGKPVTWTSSNAAMATIDSTGMTTGIAPGSVTFTASVAGVSGTANVTEAAVVVPVVASVSVTPATATSNVGATLALVATVKDQNSNVLTGKLITWASSNSAIATVDANGTTTGIAAGTVTFTATVAGISGASTVTEVAVVQQSALYPNQPAGLTRFAEVNFNALPGAAGAAGTLAGNFFTLLSPATHMAIVSDATAPQGSSALQVDFEQGTQPGYEVGVSGGYRQFGGWDGPGALTNTEYSEYYESTWFKIPTADFETQEVGVKILGYWGVGNNNQSRATGTGPTELYALMRGSGTGTSIMSSWNLDMSTQGISSTYVPQNMNLGTKITAGSWHHFETYMKLNTIGQSNGVWKWWLDGVLIGDYENMQFINATQSSGFWGRAMNLVWGGQGGTAKTRTDHILFNHMYMSGVFLRAAAPCGC